MHGRDAVKGVPTSALSPLPERMGAQEHTSLCGSKALLSTCSLLRAKEGAAGTKSLGPTQESASLDEPDQ